MVEYVRGRRRTHRVRVFDNGPEWADRYTIVYLDEVNQKGQVNITAIGEDPQRFCLRDSMSIHCVGLEGRGGVFRREIRVADLPPGAQQVIQEDIELTEAIEKRGASTRLRKLRYLGGGVR